MNQNPERLLQKHNIDYKIQGHELVTKCIFNDCDSDSRPNEAHLYISAENGLFDCKKCGEHGNYQQLATALGEPAREHYKAKTGQSNLRDGLKPITQAMKDYLQTRGITEELISDFGIGLGSFYNKNWIGIPIKDSNGKLLFYKLRRDPKDEANPTKYIFYPKGSEAELFNSQALTNTNMVVICEGEFDCMILESQGIPAVTSTAGAATFKDEWLEYFQNMKKVYVCLDNDEPGQKAAEQLIDKLSNKFPNLKVYNVCLPQMTNGKDITDYFVSYGGNPDELMQSLPELKAGPEEIDTSKFEPMNLGDLAEVLELTIKSDTENKLATFFCELSAYTEDSQFNISFNAPSSSGKSFIPTEIAKLFPKEDLLKIGYCTPQAFFHDNGVFDKATSTRTVDLSRKILIFLDQPHNQLLQRLRPLLSHDDKELVSKLTDKTAKFGTKTKTVIIKGYPAVIFCTAGMKIDEQEATRFLLLSPEVTQDKINQGIDQILEREKDPNKFDDWVSANPARKLLAERIVAIKQAEIRAVLIPDSLDVKRELLKRSRQLKPRHQRDVKRLTSLIKSIALLNLWWRDFGDNTITANQDDIAAAIGIWNKLSISQELNLPPYIFKMYEEVIKPLFEEKNSNRNEVMAETFGNTGISRQEIQKKHFEVYDRMLDAYQLRQEILPMLENAGLITQDSDPSDKRRQLIFVIDITKNNSVEH